jgi:hypothetical protein
MAKGAAKAAMTTNNTATNNAGTFSNRGGQAWSAAFPELAHQANNPTGFSDQQLANMNTANSQSVGGGQAAAVGQGNLMAGRTRNAGGFGAALDQSAQNAGKQLSQNAVGIQNANAELAQNKQQNALRELGSLYGTNTQGLNDMLGQSNAAIKNWTDADAETNQAIQGYIGDAQKIATTPFGGG